MSAHHGHAHSHTDDSHHRHDHHGHDHGHGHAHEGGSERRLLIAFVLTAVAMVAEAVGGWLSGSLALFADAGHMLVDTFALLLAWAGAHFAQRPADAQRSFGYARLEVLVGYTNALVQFALVAWIVVESITRLFAPEPILSGLMLIVAAAGLAINALVLFALGGHDHDDLNSAGARLHVIGDLLGSLGAVIAAGLIRWCGWLWADPAISIVVAVLILGSAWRLLRRSAHILLEGTPEGVELADVTEIVRQQSGIRDVHHVHVWQLAGGKRMATLHAHLMDGTDAGTALNAVQRVLGERFRIGHATIQFDDENCVERGCSRGSVGH